MVSRLDAGRSASEVTAGDSAVEAVVDRWAEARLLTLDRHPQSRLPTVEPAHEALFREWPRLRRWLDEDRGALVLLGHLREAAESWGQLERDPGALYRGSRLQSAADALGAAPLPALEREFLEAGLEARAVEEREAAARAQHQVKANRRLRRQLVAIGVALVVALIGGFVAVDQRHEAVGERRVAFVRELAAAADASVEEDPERAMLLALEAVEVSQGAGDDIRPEALEALHRAVSRSRIVLSVPDLGGALDWSPDGSVFVTEGPEETGLVDVRDAETGESVLSFVGHEIDINDVAFAADSTAFATTRRRRTAPHLGHRDRETSWRTLAGERETCGGLVVQSRRPAGRRSVDGTGGHAGLRSPQRRGAHGGELARPAGSDFSADGAHLALASFDRLLGWRGRCEER